MSAGGWWRTLVAWLANEEPPVRREPKRVTLVFGPWAGEEHAPPVEHADRLYIEENGGYTFGRYTPTPATGRRTVGYYEPCPSLPTDTWFWHPAERDERTDAALGGAK